VYGMVLTSGNWPVMGSKDTSYDIFGNIVPKAVLICCAILSL
jgi:hypothetical protein